MSEIRVALVGVGNSASALIQGVHYYKNAKENTSVPGLMHVNFGGYHIRDVRFVAAFEVNENKIGKDLSEAIFVEPNCCAKFAEVPHLGVEVSAAPVFKRIADVVAPINLTWLEIDTHDAPALAEIKRGTHCPIASCETLHGRREFKPFFDNYATDVAIVDVIWNGLNESLKIASMADVYEVNVAPHNFYGHLCSAITGHRAASATGASPGPSAD